MYAASPFSYNNNLNLWLWSLYTFFFADNFLELWGAQVLPLNHHEGRLKNCCKFYCKPQKVKNTHTHIFQTRKKEGWYLVHKQFIYKKHTSFWWKSFSDYQLAKQKFCPSTVWFVLLSIYPPPPFLYVLHCLENKKTKNKNNVKHSASRCAGRKCFTASKRMPVTPEQKNTSFEVWNYPFFTENDDFYPSPQRLKNEFTVILETVADFCRSCLNLWKG